MLAIEDVINLFGLSPQDEILDTYLTSQGLSERPEFEENPEEWVSKKEDGFILVFREKLGYEKLYGQTNAAGSMILAGVRLHGPQNANKFLPYTGKLPFGLGFGQTPEELTQLLGSPDFEDEPGTPERVLMWNNFKGLQIGMVLTPDEKNISYITIRPAQRKLS